MNNKLRLIICIGLVAVLLCTGASGVSRRCCCITQISESVSCCKTRAAGVIVFSEGPACCRSADSFKLSSYGGDAHRCDCGSGETPERFRRQSPSEPLSIEIGSLAFCHQFSPNVSEEPKAVAVSVPLITLKPKRCLLCVWRL